MPKIDPYSIDVYMELDEWFREDLTEAFRERYGLAPQFYSTVIGFPFRDVKNGNSYVMIWTIVINDMSMPVTAGDYYQASVDGDPEKLAGILGRQFKLSPVPSPPFPIPEYDPHPIGSPISSDPTGRSFHPSATDNWPTGKNFTDPVTLKVYRKIGGITGPYWFLKN
jgi:hypothetical protein